MGKGGIFKFLPRLGKMLNPTLVLSRGRVHNVWFAKILLKEQNLPVVEVKPLTQQMQFQNSLIARTDPVIPWEALLTHTPILGLTEVNFCMLLSQRWDMKSDAILSAEEAKYVEELRSTYKQI